MNIKQYKRDNKIENHIALKFLFKKEFKYISKLSLFFLLLSLGCLTGYMYNYYMQAYSGMKDFIGMTIGSSLYCILVLGIINVILLFLHFLSGIFRKNRKEKLDIMFKEFAFEELHRMNLKNKIDQSDIERYYLYESINDEGLDLSEVFTIEYDDSKKENKKNKKNVNLNESKQSSKANKKHKRRSFTGLEDADSDFKDDYIEQEKDNRVRKMHRQVIKCS